MNANHALYMALYTDHKERTGHVPEELRATYLRAYGASSLFLVCKVCHYLNEANEALQEQERDAAAAREALR